MTEPSPVEVPDQYAAAIFGARLPLVERYARWLAEDGTERGLLGPREAPRLWSRHLLNCAVVADLIRDGAAVADVGAGAGLPGMVVALRRPDLRVTLVEPLLRRCQFLAEVVDDLGLGDSVEVVRARAEELHGRRTFDVVTARAVAPLGRLAAWCLPLVAPRGQLLALKGASAAEELQATRPALERWGVEGSEVLALGSDLEPTWVVRVQLGDQRGSGGRPGPRRSAGSRPRKQSTQSRQSAPRTESTPNNRSGR